MSDPVDNPRAAETVLQWGRLNAAAPVALSPHSFDALAAECCRRVAVQIDQLVSARKVDGAYALGVTGVESGAGKSLTSINLALALSRKGEFRVLLLEADVWRPSLRRYLEVDVEIPGLMNVLSKEVLLPKAKVSIWGLGLDVIFAGKHDGIEDPGDLMTTRRVSDVLQAIKPHYDYVVIDMPAVLLASGRSLVAAADGNLLVVRAGKTRRKAIEEGLSILGPEKTLGIVLNDARVETGVYATYGLYSSYPEYYGVSGARLGAHADRMAVDDPATAGESRRLPSWSRLAVSTLFLLAVLALLLVGLPGTRWRGLLNGEESASERPVTLAPLEAGSPFVAAPDDEVGQHLGAGRATEIEWVGGPEDDDGAAVPGRSITPTALNLRAGPGTSYERLEVLPAQTSFDILDRRGQWLEIETGGRQGWVHIGSTSLRDEPPLATEELDVDVKEPSGGARTITPVNFRAAPGTEHDRLSVLPAGITFEVIGEVSARDGLWLRVQAEGQRGWVHAGGTDFDKKDTEASRRQNPAEWGVGN